jgi:hypothetical protein
MSNTNIDCFTVENFDRKLQFTYDIKCSAHTLGTFPHFFASRFWISMFEIEIAIRETRTLSSCSSVS